MTDTAQVPLIVTRKMRADLLQHGFTEDQISGMTAQQAWESLGGIPSPNGSHARPQAGSAVNLVDLTLYSQAESGRILAACASIGACRTLDIIGDLDLDLLRDEIAIRYLSALQAQRVKMIDSDSDKNVRWDVAGALGCAADLMHWGAGIGDAFWWDAAQAAVNKIKALEITRLTSADLVNEFSDLVSKPEVSSTPPDNFIDNQVTERLRVDPWQVFTLADAYQERPPVEYIAGLFALPSLSIPYGPPGALKSFILADLCICAAAGIDWLPPAPWVEGNVARGVSIQQPYPVMWLDFDNGRRRTHDRFGALGRARRLPADTPLSYYSMPSPWLNASDKASIGNLALRIQDKGARLVVIDNLGVVSGDAEENSGDMVRVMSSFRQIAEDTGAAVVLIHHQRKSTGTGGRAGDALRGHSSIEAALDLALVIEREDYSDIITLKATKMRGVDVLPFSAVFSYEHGSNGELYTAKFFGVTADDNKSGAAIEREIFAALKGSSKMNKTELTKAVKENLPDVGINRIRDMIARLEAAGRLNVMSGSRTEKDYYNV